MTVKSAADCHAHVFGGGEYPYAADRVYEPDPCQKGTARDFRAVLDAHGLTHGLLVSAQPYGPDNRCMLDAIGDSGGRFKGIALVTPDVSDRELRRLADSGVVGIRINLSTHGMTHLTEPGADRLFDRVAEMGWFLQVHCAKDELLEAMPLLGKVRPRIMIDHFGRPDIRRGVAHPGFQALLELGRSGRAIVKLSGPFRASLEGPPYRDVDPFIAAAVEAFTLDNCVWGSDWPFVRVEERVDYGPGFACVPRWFPDAKDRRLILWENPVRLFGFRPIDASRG